MSGEHSTPTHPGVGLLALGLLLLPREGKRATHIPTPCSGTPPGDVRPRRGDDHADAPSALSPLPDRRPSGSHLARRRRRAGADLVLDRPARREPGARQPDGRSAQAPLLRPPGPPRRQGDRGGLPLGVQDRLRLLPPSRGGGFDPCGHHDRRADPGPAGAHRADLRGDRGRRRAIVHLYNSTSETQRRVVFGSTETESRSSRCGARSSARSSRPETATHDRVPVLPGELPPHRARLRARDLRGRGRRVGTDTGGPDDRQPADHGRGVPPERLRRPDGVVLGELLAPRQRDPLRPPAQRPWNRGRDRRSSA